MAVQFAHQILELTPRGATRQLAPGIEANEGFLMARPSGGDITGRKRNLGSLMAGLQFDHDTIGIGKLIGSHRAGFG